MPLGAESVAKDAHVTTDCGAVNNLSLGHRKGTPSTVAATKLPRMRSDVPEMRIQQIHLVCNMYIYIYNMITKCMHIYIYICMYLCVSVYFIPIVSCTSNVPENDIGNGFGLHAMWALLELTAL